MSPLSYRSWAFLTAAGFDQEYPILMSDFLRLSDYPGTLPLLAPAGVPSVIGSAGISDVSGGKGPGLHTYAH